MPMPNVAIVGGSLTGLAVANVLYRLGYRCVERALRPQCMRFNMRTCSPTCSFTVYEKFSGSFADRGSSLGYVNIPLWEALTGRQMRRYNAQAHRSQGAYYYGDLWSYLYAGLPEGSVRFGQEVRGCDDDDNDGQPAGVGRGFRLTMMSFKIFPYEHAAAGQGPGRGSDASDGAGAAVRRGRGSRRGLVQPEAPHHREPKAARIRGIRHLSGSVWLGIGGPLLCCWTPGRFQCPIRLLLL